jgi:hypothetical protein
VAAAWARLLGRCPGPPGFASVQAVCPLATHQLRPRRMTGWRVSWRMMRLPPSVVSGGGGMPRGGAAVRVWVWVCVGKDKLIALGT